MWILNLHLYFSYEKIMLINLAGASNVFQLFLPRPLLFLTNWKQFLNCTIRMGLYKVSFKHFQEEHLVPKDL